MNRLIIFWAVWILGVVVSHAAINAVPEVENRIVDEVAAATTEQQQQRREGETSIVTEMDMDTSGPIRKYTITTNFSTTGAAEPVQPQQQPEPEIPPCGCQQTLTRVVCSASTIQYETFILARLSSLANVPTTSTMSSDMINLLQDNMVNAYNELQNLHHCDRPYFREMLSAELMLSDDESSNGNTTSLDELYLNFKAVIKSHLDIDGKGPAQPIALDGATTTSSNGNTRLLLQQQEEVTKTSSSISNSLPPLIRHLRQLQNSDVGGDCTCPTALAADTSVGGSFTSEADLQQEYNERLLLLFGPPTTSEGGGGDDGSSSNSIDEVLQLSPVEDLGRGGQCYPRTGSSSSQPATTTSAATTTMTATTTIGGVVTPLQVSSSTSSSFQTVFIMHLELQPGWQYNEDAPTEEQAATVDELVQMQMRLLQDSYNDEAFRNCDSYFRRIINTVPILVQDTNTTVRRKRQRHLQLQQFLSQQLQQGGGGADDDGDVDDGEASSSLLMMGNHSSVDDSKQQEQEQQQQESSSISSSSRLLFQPIHSSTSDIFGNMAMLAVRVTVDCLNDNCPADKKALANSDVTSAASSQQEDEEEHVVTRRALQQQQQQRKVEEERIAAAAAGLRGNTATTNNNNKDGRHLLWSDVMGGCYCPAHLEGTGTAPTNETLISAMNKNMQLIDEEESTSGSGSSSSLVVELVTAIYEVDIHDCSQPRSDFETVVSVMLVGDQDQLMSTELTALGDGFESTYNSIVFQTCDPLFRSIDAVQVFIPPVEDPARRRQRLLLKNGGNSSNPDDYDKDNEQRMLQTTTKKPFVSGYAVKGKCVGLCPKEDTLFTGGFGTRQRQRRDATTTADAAADKGILGGKKVPTDQELRSWIQSSPAFSSTFSTFQRGLQSQEGDECTCAAGSAADETFVGPTVELMNLAYSLKVEELKAQGEVVNVDSVDIMEEPVLCKCKTAVVTSCAIPITNIDTVDGVKVLGEDEYPCNLSCDEFDEVFGIVSRRRRRRLQQGEREVHEIICDHGIFVCPTDEL